MSSSSKRMIILESSEGDKFEVEEAVAVKSQRIKDMIEASTFIPLPSVTSKILAKVIEFCKRHVDAEAKASGDEDLKSFDAAFVKVDKATLFGLTTAANYLNIESLLRLTGQTAVDTMKGMKTEEMRVFLNIENSGFTPEEEEEIRRENAWAFE